MDREMEHEAQTWSKNHTMTATYKGPGCAFEDVEKKHAVSEKLLENSKNVALTHFV